MQWISQRLTRTCCALALLLASPLAASPADTAAAEPSRVPIRFKVLIEKAGIYRIAFEDLRDAGLGDDEPATTFRLTNRGEPVPVLRLGGEGPLGPGDELVFRAERLHGDHSYYHDHSRLNVYVLEIGGDPGPAMRAIPAPAADASATPRLRIVRSVHRERDLLLHRFFRRAGDPPADDWFWRRLTQIDPEPFRLRFDLQDLGADGAVRLRLAFRGWSKPRGTRRLPPEGAPPPDELDADHVVEVRLNDVPIGRTAWYAQEEHLLTIDPVPAAALVEGRNTLEISVPKRIRPESGDPIVDVVLFNWVELEHSRGGRLLRAQETLRRAPESGWVVLEADETAEVLVFSDEGTVSETLADGERHVAALEAAAGPSSEIHVVRNGAFARPESIVRDRPSDLRASRRQVDYLMIAHPTLLDAIEPLADFHRERGLAVEVIDVFDAYDEFSHGIVEPHAIRDLIAHAHRERPAPAPRFVLLVGDASWDTKNREPRSTNYVDWTYRPGEVERTPRNQLTPYEEGSELDRNLVPTWMHQGAQGHAASDNYFVAVVGDDELPDLAIGRLPVVEPAEVAAIVDKTIRYAGAEAVGPWRRSILWIANESPAFQDRSDEMAASTTARGYSNTKIYPSPEEADNADHQAALLRSLNEGQLLVHFLGHGGRYIWRTGPPDFRKNHDLFTLEHLDQLAPTEALPIILSMTCYSAPFDHPTADSIGEKFLRLADRGAVAVLAASWRNSPGRHLSEGVLTGLLAGDSIGEAVMEAKRGLKRRDLIETYNLLGDPAITAPAPQERLELTLVATGDGDPAVRVRTASGEELAGSLLVDWLGERDDVLLTERLEATGGAVDLALPRSIEESPVGVTAYLWDEASGRDGIGALSFDDTAGAPAELDGRP